MKKYVKLYNLILPIWFLWILPFTWIIAIPANFIIDFLVISITMKIMKIQNALKNAFKIIVIVVICGFLSDLAGSLVLYIFYSMDFGSGNAFNDWWYQNITSCIAYNPLANRYAFLIVCFSILVSGILIYILNYNLSFGKIDFTKEQKRKICLSLAIFTAPYLYLLPLEYLGWA